MRRPMLAVTLALVALPAGAGAPPAFDALFDPGLSWRSSDTAWRPDGAWLTYVWKGDDGRRSLHALDATNGDSPWSLDYSALVPPGESTAIEPDAYLWAPASDALLFRAGGDLYLYRLADRGVRRLTRTEAEESDPAFSPDGSSIAFVRAANLWVLDLESGREVQLTEDGAPEELLNGTTDWVYWEELWNREAEGFWWSPDSRTLAFYRFDERAVERYPLLDERTQYPAVRWQRYPKAGTAIPAVRIGVVDVASRAVTWLETGDPAASYLARVHWRADARKLAVERLSRDQTRLDLLLCAPLRGDCATWAAQSAPTGVTLGDDFRFLADGGFVWGSEESGWRRLDRYDALGRRQRSLTPEGLALADLQGVFGRDQTLIATLYRTSGLGPAERQIAAIDLDTGAPRWLAGGPGWHKAEVDPTGRHWLHEWSDLDTPPRKTIETIGGGPAVELPGAPVWPAALLDLPRSELFTIPGPEGSHLPVRLVKPAGFDPSRRYPVLMYHYGGPAAQVVANSFNTKVWPWHRWLAAHGYAVLAVDNQASIYFGKRGEERLHRRFGPVELAAQLAAVDYLRTLAWTDTSRLALWGWSGGGANTLYSMFHAPGTWRAGIAGAPVSDFRFYDAIWAERYLGTPQENPDGYAASAALEAAAALRDALLLVHGTGDDNVHPQNTIALLERLVASGRPVEDALYPREKHTFGDAAWKHALARMTAFLDAHLRPAGGAPD